MPAKSEKQRKAAGAELGRRRAGTKKSSTSKRPFAAAKTATVRKFAKKAK